MRRVAPKPPASIRSRSGRRALHPYLIEDATFTLAEIRRVRTRAA